MGRFFTDVLCLHHDVALFDTNAAQLRFVFNTRRMTRYDEIAAFEPQLLLNAVTLHHTTKAFAQVIPHLPAHCILSDIASVKTGLREFYDTSGFRYASSHPMFGPTFATLDRLQTQNAILISESDPEGKEFYRTLYHSLKLRVFDYTFAEHDETIAYSLSVPFASTLVFAAVMKRPDAPGTTFQRHMDIARGLLSEDDFLLTEILFNPFTADKIETIRAELATLLDIVKTKNSDRMKTFLTAVRKRIE